MLPKLLSGSYQQYKEDTNYFVDWLSKAARACGHKLDNLSKAQSAPSSAEEQLPKTPRLRGRARKLAREAAAAEWSKIKPASPAQQPPRPVNKYSITIKDLIAQAKVVASTTNPKIAVPKAILRVVQRALNARKRCTTWFIKTGAKNNHSDRGHIHFIEALEEVIDILEPIASGKASQSSLVQTPQEAALGVLSNRFQALEVQESKDDDEELPPPPPSVVRKSKGPSNDISDDAFELLPEEYDFVFRAFCFFEDLEKIREFLKGTWKRYRILAIDLVTATMTTSVALHLLEREEAHFFEAMPKGVETNCRYADIVSIIYHAEAFKEGLCLDHYLESKDRLVITPIEEFVYLPTARTLYRFHQVRRAMNKVGENTWVPLVPSARIDYAARPELLKSPALKRWQNEYDRLMRLLLDCDMHQVFSSYLDKQEDLDFLIEDPFARALRLMKEHDKITTTTVFTCRVLLDIQDVLGKEIEISYKQLLENSTRASSKLDVQLSEDGVFGPRQEVSWLTKDMNIVLRLWRTSDTQRKEMVMNSVKMVVLRDKEQIAANMNDLDLPSGLFQDMEEMEEMEEIEKILEAKYGGDMGADNSHVLPEHRRTVESMDLKPLRHSRDGLFFVKQNPLYCGIVSFQMLLDLETSGITLANFHNSILAIAHLYHASQHLGLLDGVWPELDSAIQIHQQTLFGGKLPNTPKEMYSRLLIKLGATARNFARNQGAKSFSKRELFPKKIPPLEPNQFLDRFRSHYLGTETLQRSLYQLEYQIQEQWGFLEKKRRKNIEWTPIELIAAIEVQMPIEIRKVESAEYLELTRKCIEVLKAVRAELNRRLDNLFPRYPGDDDRSSNEPLHLVMVMMILYEISDIQEAKGDAPKTLRKFLPEIAPQLSIAAEVLQGFVTKPSLRVPNT